MCIRKVCTCWCNGLLAHSLIFVSCLFLLLVAVSSAAVFPPITAPAPIEILGPAPSPTAAPQPAEAPFELPAEQFKPTVAPRISESVPPAPAPTVDGAALVAGALSRFGATTSADVFLNTKSEIRLPGPSTILAPTESAWQQWFAKFGAQVPGPANNYELGKLILQGLTFPNVHWTYQDLIDNNGTVLSTLLPGVSLQVLYLPAAEVDARRQLLTGEITGQVSPVVVTDNAIRMCFFVQTSANTFSCTTVGNAANTPSVNAHLVDNIPFQPEDFYPSQGPSQGPTAASIVDAAPFELPAEILTPTPAGLQVVGGDTE